jgi:uncharacterized phage-associated protein
MKQDEILKLKSAFLYILNKQRYIDQFHAFKILYFADREHLAKYGRRIIHDTFYAMENGPVPSNLYDTVKFKNGHLEKPQFYNAVAFKPILDSFETGSGDTYYYLSAKELPDLDELSKSDMECLDLSFSKYKDLDMGELSDVSHDTAWSKAWIKRQNCSIDYLDMAEAGGASEDLIEYIRESEELASYLQ